MGFIDANIFMYAAGEKSPQQLPCQNFLKKISSTKFDGEFFTSVEVLQEILHRYTYINKNDLGFKLFDSILSLNITILPIDTPEVMEAKNLLISNKKLSARDAVHLGTMKRYGLNRIYSYDKGFSQIDWVERVEPSF